MNRIQPARGAIVLTVFLLLVGGASSAAAQSRTGQDIAEYAALMELAESEPTVRVIVQVADFAAQEALLDELADYNVTVVAKYQIAPLLALQVDAPALLAIVESPLVLEIEEDVAVPPSLNGTIPLINADDVWALGFDGSGFAVAILDTGIDRDHPFFTGKIVSEACYSNAGGAGGEVTLCPNGMNSQTGAGAADAETAQCISMGNNICDHGSHVAGIAAGNGTGVMGAPPGGVGRGANIIAIQVFTRFNAASDCSPNPAPCVLSFTSDQILGLQQVATLNGTFNIAAANLSLGDGNLNTSNCDGDTRKAAIDNLRSLDIATTISAGNDGFTNGVSAPGCISTAITVGATTDADALPGFTNRGSLLELFAPGFNVFSSVPDDTFGNKNGTSMAAPHVAGAWAVLREAYPSLTVAQVLQLLQVSGGPITYASGGGTVTTPRIDLLAALQAGTDPPVLTVDDASVTVDEGQTAMNTGTFSDPDGDPVTLSASVGSVMDTGGGNWSWSYLTSDGPTDSQTVVITGTDDKDVDGEVTFELIVNNIAPDVDAGPDDEINEGDEFTSSGSFTDPGSDTWTATVNYGDGTGDQALTLAPDKSFSLSHGYGDDGIYTVTVTATDDDGDSGSDTASVTVNNVAPTVIAGTDVTIDEGDVANVSATFEDPGWLDTYLTEIEFEFGPMTEIQAGTLMVVDGGPGIPDQGTLTGSLQYGDDGMYLVTLEVEDDDGGVGSDTLSITVNNVDPTAEINLSGATDVNGAPTVFGTAGDPVDFSGQSMDPGSDDLTLTWDWDNGTPDTVTSYLVSDPASDPPFPPGSPDVNPRNVTDDQSHTFEGACVFTIGFSAEDDDGGLSPVDSAQVLIVGTADEVRSAGYWLHQYRGNGKIDFDSETLECYLSIVEHMSTVFSEATSISSIEDAEEVLFVQGNRGSMEEIFDRQLLAAWLNFANGAIGLDEMVDTDGDDVPDTTFWDALQTAEAVRLDPFATRAELEEQKDILERINQMHG